MRRMLAVGMITALWATSLQAAEIIVSAAASLTNAFRAIGKIFDDANPGHKAIFNFASSDVLLAQISKGAPADVFATADMESMDKAEKQGLLAAGTRRTLLSNKLTLITPAGGSAKPTNLAGLDDGAVRRIAIGNPASVPAGRYAKEAMEKAGVWAKLEPKLIMAQNVRQALDYVARGEVDAGLVYATDAAIMADKVVVTGEIPTTTPVLYPVAIVHDTRNRQLADAFVKLLASARAQSIFRKYGFSQP